MPYFVETAHRKPNGQLITWRLAARGMQDAVDLAFSTAEHFVDDPPKKWKIGEPRLFINDYGEIVRIQAVEYGWKAQVQEGLFVL